MRSRTALPRVVVPLLLLGAALTSTSALHRRDPLACAMFRPSNPADGVPVLSIERILLTFDPSTSTEHFVREIKVAKGVKRFGFVVPVPSRPTIAKVSADVFTSLGIHYPSVPPAPSPPPQGFTLSRSKSVSVAAAVASPASVDVQATQKIGSFTAITLAAKDTEALQTWLRENGLSSPPSHTRWLDHYVALGFTFVAFRFEGAEDPNAEMVSERVRLSFSSPAPFYPYLEPASDGSSEAATRLLQAWVVAPSAMRPLAAYVGNEPSGLTLRHGSPWSSGLEYESASKLAEAVPEAAAWLPAGTSRVHTFLDRKQSRDGWGDIVFVPRAPNEPTAGGKEKLRSLLPVIDPTLGGRSSMVTTGASR